MRTIASLALAATLTLATAVAAPTIDPDLLAGLKARSIGPAGMSGRIAAIAAPESDPTIVYVGAATGGVWKSANGGLTFTPIFDDQPVAAIGAIAIFQPNPDIVWVGTGEGNVRNSVSVGNGVYRSLDAGRTWTHLGLDDSERIARIITHPTDPDTVWVAALGHEWGPNTERGVFKTTDGGKTWKKVLYVDDHTGAADLALDPADPNHLLVSMWQYQRWPYFFRSGGPSSGLWATHDGGTTWKQVHEEDGLPKGPLGRIGISFSRSHPEIVYALVEARKSALVRSDDGGHTWKTMSDEANVAPRPFYFGDIVVDPEWPNRVYSLDYNVRVSDDAGKDARTATVLAEIHVDYHAMWIDPHDPNHFFVGEDGGVGETRDRGRTMRFIGTLPLGQFYHVAVDNEIPYNVMGGLQDNGSWRGPSSVWTRDGIDSHAWRSIGFGDGFGVEPDPTDALIGYSMSQGGALLRWNLHTGAIRSIRPPTPEGTKLRFNWNAGLALDPFAPGTIYYGSQLVQKSTDRGETWTVISPDLTTNNSAWQKQDDSGGLTPDVTAAENYCTIITIAPSPVKQGVIWVGTDDGRMHVTRDGGASWTSVEKNIPGVPANTWIPQIRASRYDPAEAFVVFDDHRRSNWKTYVLKTTDYGATWKSLATPNLRGWGLSVEQDPVDRNLLFLGTEFGLYVSLDGGASWLPFKHGLPTVAIDDLAIQEREADLVIATHGRSIYILDDIRPLRALSEKAMSEPLHLFPVADARQFARAGETAGSDLGHGEYSGANRPYGAIITFALNQKGLPLPDEDKEKARKAGERAERMRGQPWGPEVETKEPAGKGKGGEKGPQVEIRVADASGTVVRTFKSKAALGVNRAVWDLRRDPFKRYPGRADRYEEEFGRGGPEVSPGAYTVTVSYGGSEAKETVNVLQDTRTKTTAADWQQRREYLLAAGHLQEIAADAAERIKSTRTDIETIVARARKEAKDRRKANDEEAEATPGEDPALAKAGTELLTRLGELERKLWSPPDTVGIVARNHVAARIQEASMPIAMGLEPPSPTHLATLKVAEDALSGYLTELNTFFDKDVAAFRAQVDAAGVRLLAPAAPLTVAPAEKEKSASP